MFCPTCGKENALGRKFCVACGTNLEAVSQALSGSKTDFFTRTDAVLDQLLARYAERVFKDAPANTADATVGKAWKIEKTKTAATLVIEPLDKLTKKDRAALTEEGERLVRFVEPKAKSFGARFTA